MILGMNYLWESTYPFKSLQEVRRDLEEMRKYGFEAIRVTGHNLSWLITIAKEAKKLGLEVWLCPRFAHSKPMLLQREYLKKVREFANAAKKAGIDVFLIGNELSLELKDFAEIQGYENRCGENWQKFQSEFQERKNLFREYLRVLVREAKKIFSGPVTYAAGTWELDTIDWQEFDIVSANLYLWKRFAEKEYIKTLKALESYQKPVVVTEFGFTTTREAWQIGPRYIYGTRRIPSLIRNFLMSHLNLVRNILKVSPTILLKTKISHHYDEETQKRLLQKNLKILEKSNITGAFVFQWSEPFPAGFGLVRSNGTSKKALSLFQKLKP